MESKAIKDPYVQIFKDITISLRNGLISKQYEENNDFTAQNRFTRDTFELLL